MGGTHARFAVVDASGPPPWRIQDRQDLAEAFPTFIDALKSYFARTPSRAKPRVAAIAVAGPVDAGTARFTNRGWEISESDLKQFGFDEAILVNDFEALAFAAEVLVDKDFAVIGPDVKGRDGGTITILGPGTGFGVSCLARYGGRSVPMATEGGHIGFAPNDEAELAALQAMRRQKGRVSVERILSGSGLENLYKTLEELAGREPRALSAAEISTQAMQNEPGCRAALTMFCRARTRRTRRGLHCRRNHAKDPEIPGREPVPQAFRGQGPALLLRAGNTHQADRQCRRGHDRGRARRCDDHLLEMRRAGRCAAQRARR